MLSNLLERSLRHPDRRARHVETLRLERLGNVKVGDGAEKLPVYPRFLGDLYDQPVQLRRLGLCAGKDLRDKGAAAGKDLRDRGGDKIKDRAGQGPKAANRIDKGGKAKNISRDIDRPKAKPRKPSSGAFDVKRGADVRKAASRGHSSRVQMASRGGGGRAHRGGGGRGGGRRR